MREKPSIIPHGYCLWPIKFCTVAWSTKLLYKHSGLGGPSHCTNTVACISKPLYKHNGLHFQATVQTQWRALSLKMWTENFEKSVEATVQTQWLAFPSHCTNTMACIYKPLYKYSGLHFQATVQTQWLAFPSHCTNTVACTLIKNMDFENF
jgi:hypothetical protein